MRELLGLIGIIAILWIFWFYSGGPQRYDQNSGPYIKPLPPVGTGETYGPRL